jgi:hypothetical protein
MGRVLRCTIVVISLGLVLAGCGGGNGDGGEPAALGESAAGSPTTTSPPTTTTLAVSPCERATARYLDDDAMGGRSLRDCASLSDWLAAVNLTANPTFGHEEVVDAVAGLCQDAAAGFGEFAICDEVAGEVTPAPERTAPTTTSTTVPPATAPTTPIPVVHDLNGTMYLFDAAPSVDGRWQVGARCYGLDGYSDIGPGTQVTVRNESGTVIGTAALGAGTVEAWPQVGPRARRCVFPFHLAGLPDASFYGVEVSDRGEVRYPRAQLEGNGWHVAVHLG